MQEYQAWGQRGQCRDGKVDGLTNQFIQVNMDAEDFKQRENMFRKRNKKKEYKRRRRQRNKEQEKKARTKLASIITQLYSNATTFQHRQKDIDASLVYLEGGDRFHQFLNQTIRAHVTNVQKKIWEYTQTILHQNPFEKDDQQFYIEMVNKIYEEYQQIHQSSKQIEKIINLYIKITSEEQNPQTQNYNYQDLDKSTFNYLIESDETLKNLINICDRKLFSTNHTQRLKLNQIIQVMKFCQNRYYEQDQQQQQETQKSTSIEDEDHRNQPKSKTKKKRKLKQSQIRCEFEDVINRLNMLNIDHDERLPCRVSQNWLKKVHSDLIKKL